MSRLTKNPTLAEALREIKQGDEHFEINKSAYKTLLQAAGSGPEVEIWQTSFELTPGDILVVCSDGLTSCVEENRIQRVVEESDNSEIAVKELINLANEAGGHDNVTAIVAKFRPILNAGIPFPV